MLASLRLSGNLPFSMDSLMQLVKASKKKKSQSFHNLIGISPLLPYQSSSIIISLTSATNTVWKLKIGRSTNLFFIILVLG